MMLNITVFFFFLLGCFIYIIVNHEVESRKPQII